MSAARCHLTRLTRLGELLVTVSVVERPVAADRPAVLRVVPAAAPVAPQRRPRVRRAPALEPPYDDERTEWPPWQYGEQLPFEELEEQLAGAAPDVPEPGPTRRALPDPEPYAVRLIQAALETLVGRRAVAQLQDWTSPTALAELMAATEQRRWWTLGGSPAGVRSVHVSEPADGVAEVCAVIHRGERCFAVAARLEGQGGRWKCVTIQIG
jgi:hypothetical protein